MPINVDISTAVVLLFHLFQLFLGLENKNIYIYINGICVCVRGGWAKKVGTFGTNRFFE